MKKLIITALLFSGFFLHAQRGEHGEMHELSAEQLATLQTKKLTLALDLNEAQQRDIQKLNEENIQRNRAKMEARKVAREEHVSKALNPDEKFNQQLARLDKAIEHKSQMKKILSGEQFAKWEKIQTKHDHHRKANHKGNHPKERKRRG